MAGVIAIDGKTACGSRDGHNTALHTISADASASGLCLAQEHTRGKGNEIPAIKALLDTLALKGCTVTIDVIGCQTEIAQQILDRGGDCLLAIKEPPKLWPTPCGNSSPMGTSPALVVCQSAPTRPLRKIMAASKPAKPCGLPTCLGWIRNSGHIGQNLPGSA